MYIPVPSDLRKREFTSSPCAIGFYDAGFLKKRIEGRKEPFDKGEDELWLI